MPEQLAFAVKAAEPPQEDAPVKQARRSSVSDAVQRRKYIRRPKPDMHAPKRPLSGYINFSKDQRNEYEQKNWSFSTLAKQIGEDWRDLDLQKKNQYLEEAANDKLSYDQAVRRYKSTAAYSNYKKYVQEFNRRHNSSQAMEKNSSPEQSPSPSFQGDESIDGDTSMHEYYDISPPDAQAMFGEHIEKPNHNGATRTHPLGTINPASLDETTPSPTTLNTCVGMHSDYQASEFVNPMAYPVEQFGHPGLDMSMMRMDDARNLTTCDTDGSFLYNQGHFAIHNANMMGFHRISTVEEEMQYQQPGYKWTSTYMSTA